MAKPDLYQIVINWVAERQREGILNKEWTSKLAFDDKHLISLYNGPFIIILDDRYEAHQLLHARYGWTEVTGRCDAADPKFFETLLNDMIGIQSAEALRRLDETHGSC